MIVVGAGIVGTAIAYLLRKRGVDVTLIDRGEPGKGASFGNMASIAVTEFMPSSRPDIWAQMPKWLIDPSGPVSVRLSQVPRLMPWFLRFLAAGRPSRVRELEHAGKVLSARAHDDLAALLKDSDLEHMLSADGCLSIYMNEGEFRTARGHIEVLDRSGFRYELLEGGEARELEPTLSNSVMRALLLPDNRSISDPYKLVLALIERFRALGGEILKGDVTDFEQDDAGVSAARLRDGRRIHVKRVVIAAGVHSEILARKLGEPIPLETERGYHTQIMAPGISMRHSVMWPSRAFMVTPTGGGIRVGGTVEMAGLDASPDFNRAKILVRHAKEALPDLKLEGSTEWMGHRPALPDTIPVIGASGKSKNVFYATGHGHLGLTYAATTGRLIADLMTGVTPPIDIKPYRITRF